MKAEVAVLGSPSLISLTVFMDVKQHRCENFTRTCSIPSPSLCFQFQRTEVAEVAHLEQLVGDEGRAVAEEERPDVGPPVGHVAVTGLVHAHGCHHQVHHLIHVGPGALHLVGHVLQEGVEVLLAVVVLHGARRLRPRLAVHVDEVLLLYDGCSETENRLDGRSETENRLAVHADQVF